MNHRPNVETTKVNERWQFDLVLEGGPGLHSMLPLDSSCIAINTFREENARVGRYGDAPG